MTADYPILPCFLTVVAAPLVKNLMHTYMSYETYDIS